MAQQSPDPLGSFQPAPTGPRLGAPRPHPRSLRGCPGASLPSSPRSSPTAWWSAGRQSRGMPTTTSPASCRAWRWGSWPWWPCGPSTTGAFRTSPRRCSSSTWCSSFCPTFRASAPTRAWGRSPGSRSACRCSRRVREGHGGALRREPSGPLPGHAGRLARVLQGARDAARSVRGPS